MTFLPNNERLKRWICDPFMAKSDVDHVHVECSRVTTLKDTSNEFKAKFKGTLSLLKTLEDKLIEVTSHFFNLSIDIDMDCT